jgi:hypothetical protein
MRSDLDAMRERHVWRELRGELRVPTGDWGWVRVHQVAPPADSFERQPLGFQLEPARPGTPEGGF